MLQLQSFNDCYPGIIVCESVFNLIGSFGVNFFWWFTAFSLLLVLPCFRIRCVRLGDELGPDLLSRFIAKNADVSDQEMVDIVLLPLTGSFLHNTFA